MRIGVHAGLALGLRGLLMSGCGSRGHRTVSFWLGRRRYHSFGGGFRSAEELQDAAVRVPAEEAQRVLLCLKNSSGKGRKRPKLMGKKNPRENARNVKYCTRNKESSSTSTHLLRKESAHLREIVTSQTAVKGEKEREEKPHAKHNTRTKGKSRNA